MLSIKNLTVTIDSQVIIPDLSLEIKPGSTHALMGPNGSGKSTLAGALAGNPYYHCAKGAVFFYEKNITNLSPDKRANAGIFLSFQQPIAIPGVTVCELLKQAYHAKFNTIDGFDKKLSDAGKTLLIDRSMVSRSLNDGFSGGEKKRFEMLQMLVLQPKLVILDEVDSGLDIDALKVVAKAIKTLQKEQSDTSVFLITHYQRILDYVQPDYVHILSQGRLIQSGDKALVQRIEQHGYGQL